MTSQKTLGAVVDAFLVGRPKRAPIARPEQTFKHGLTGDGKPAIWTDGHVLYSYNMPIAFRWLAGRTEGDVGGRTESITVIDREAAPSRTTELQIDATLRAVARSNAALWRAPKATFDKNLLDGLARANLAPLKGN